MLAVVDDDTHVRHEGLGFAVGHTDTDAESLGLFGTGCYVVAVQIPLWFDRRHVALDGRLFVDGKGP